MQINRCRLCGYKRFRKILSLGKIYISTFVKSGNLGKYPLTLILCENCQLLQLRDSAPANILYSNHYWYQSKLNPVIVKDLKEIVEQSLQMVRMEKDDVFLDIGAILSSANYQINALTLRLVSY